MNKSSFSDSSIKIGSKNKFKGDTIIGNKAKIIKNKYITDNSVRYDGHKRDVSNIEHLSMFITSKFDEKKANFWGVLSGLGGLAGILVCLNSVFSGDMKIFSFLPKFSQSIGITGIVISFVFMLGGVIVVSAINYKYESQCPKCKKHYSMQETGTPKVREVDARNGTKVTTTRFYKCNNCGFTKPISETETIPYEQTDSN